MDSTIKLQFYFLRGSTYFWAAIEGCGLNTSPEVVHDVLLMVDHPLWEQELIELDMKGVQMKNDRGSCTVIQEEDNRQLLQQRQHYEQHSPIQNGYKRCCQARQGYLRTDFHRCFLFK
jgi:hypothetical protein